LESLARRPDLQPASGVVMGGSRAAPLLPTTSDGQLIAMMERLKAAMGVWTEMLDHLSPTS
jgi:hypothetical protein